MSRLRLWEFCHRSLPSRSPTPYSRPVAPHTIFDALQLAVSPVIMISAYGMLLLSMTNRLGRAIDRARELAGAGAPGRSRQIEILVRRARWIRSSILLIVVAIFMVAMLVLFLFASVFVKVDLKVAVSTLFVASLLSLMLSLACLMADIFGALRAMEAELRD